MSKISVNVNAPSPLLLLKPLQICPARSCSLIGQPADWPEPWLAESFSLGQSCRRSLFCRLRLKFWTGSRCWRQCGSSIQVIILWRMVWIVSRTGGKCRGSVFFSSFILNPVLAVIYLRALYMQTVIQKYYSQHFQRSRVWPDPVFFWFLSFFSTLCLVSAFNIYFAHFVTVD